MLNLRGSNNSFKLDGDLSKAMTIHNVNVTLSNPQDQKLIFEFGKPNDFR